MLNDTREVELRSMEKNRKHQLKSVERDTAALPSKGTKKYSIPGARVIKTAGNDYGVVHISLIMAVGVAEVVWVTATYIM